MLRSVTHAVLYDGETRVAEFALDQHDEKTCFKSGSIGYHGNGKTDLKDGQRYQVSVQVTQVGSQNTIRAAEYAERQKAKDAEKAKNGKIAK